MTEGNEQGVQSTLVYRHNSPLRNSARYPTALLATGIVALVLLAMAARSYRRSEHGVRTALRVSEGAALTHLVQHVDPVYPDIAKQMQVEPKVIYEIAVGKDGTVIYINGLNAIHYSVKEGLRRFAIGNSGHGSLTDARRQSRHLLPFHFGVPRAPAVRNECSDSVPATPAGKVGGPRPAERKKSLARIGTDKSVPSLQVNGRLRRPHASASHRFSCGCEHHAREMLCLQKIDPTHSWTRWVRVSFCGILLGVPYRASRWTSGSSAYEAKS